jgi:hypothetical protein
MEANRWNGRKHKETVYLASYELINVHHTQKHLFIHTVSTSSVCERVMSARARIYSLRLVARCSTLSLDSGLG